ncbi:MAG: riboflavin synthase [Thermoanaerobaculia bacterium]|nr:riboflavin synthase [Thermoanaerobaculia bacterium]
MFTGLISAVARVASLRSGPQGAVLAVERPAEFGDVVVGESIAVSGVCLTVVPPAGPGQALSVDVSPETLARSSLGDLGAGSRVNLERALRASDRLGGHIVAGHVDGTARVLGVEKAGDSWMFRFSLPASLARYAVEKGSISVDGISLTVAALEEGSFDVAVIPHTFEATTLGGRKPGDLVNLEVDVLGKYVERLLAARLADPDAGARDERLKQLLTNGA